MEQSRREIDSINREILELIQKRFFWVLKISKKKNKLKFKIEDKKREKQILDYVSKISFKKFLEYNLVLFFNIINISKCLQYDKLYSSKIRKIEKTKNRKVYTIAAFSIEREFFVKRFQFKRILQFKTSFKALESLKNDESDFLIYNSKILNLKEILKEKKLKLYLNCKIEFKGSTYYIVSKKIYVGVGEYLVCLNLTVERSILEILNILTTIHLKKAYIEKLYILKENINYFKICVIFKIKVLNREKIFLLLKTLSCSCKKLEIINIYKIKRL